LFPLRAAFIQRRAQRASGRQIFINAVVQDRDVLQRIVTGDESWCFQFDPETKLQSMEWHGPSSPKPKKVMLQNSRIKKMVIVFLMLLE
jgi:hypothetical protein